MDKPKLIFIIGSAMILGSALNQSYKLLASGALIVGVLWIWLFLKIGKQNKEFAKVNNNEDRK